jgi:hypothetical protein
MTPIQQLMLGVGAKKKTYVDDVYSSYLWTGNASSGRSINTGLDMSGKGGLTWIKRRDAVQEVHCLNDTARGAGMYMQTNSTAAPISDTNRLASFTSTGFTVGTDSCTNSSNSTYSSWNFRKAEKYFTIIEWTGNGTAGKTVSHDLGCIPGCMIVRRITSGGSPASSDWTVYHTSIGGGKSQRLNASSTTMTGAGPWNDTDPTSSVITLGSSADTNGNNDGYIGYLFAGGSSTAATARSVEFDGGSEQLATASDSNIVLGTGDFTIEGWFKIYGVEGQYLFDQRISGEGHFATLWMDTDGKIKYYTNSADRITSKVITINQWFHAAVVRSSGVIKLYINGKQEGVSYSDSNNYAGDSITIGQSQRDNPNAIYGSISNFRLTKQALYTSSFRPPTAPFTTTSQGATSSNVKLLCCNNASVTGSTVTTGALSSSGTLEAKTESPFDDSDGFAFGDSGEENLIRCGAYKGNGSATAGPEIFLGWEPQFLIVKASSKAEGWHLIDTMRGITADGDTKTVFPENSNGDSALNRLAPTATGFKLTSSDNSINGNNASSAAEYLYIAIRRPDPLVQKPQLSTDVFAMDTGNSSSTGPAFDSTFAVDFSIMKQPAAVLDWRAFSRLTAERNLAPDGTGAEGAETNNSADYNDGIGKNYTNVWQAWMWKRHKGFDVVTYKASGIGGSKVRHSCGVVPEMLWVKRRSASAQWMCYHKGLNGGTNPEQYSIALDDTGAEVNPSMSVWNDTAPTALDVTLSDHGNVNEINNNYLMMVFASVEGISKCGYYTGSGSTGFSVTTGFSPRYIIIKRADSADYWAVFDTLRGLASGNDPMLKLNSSAAQITGVDIIDPTSTGFDIVSTDSALNGSNGKYIYYAHA